MKDALLTLPSSELRALAASLRTGRLTAPYTGFSLRRFFTESLATSVAASLQSMAESGMSPSAAAHSLELLASSISEHPPVEDFVDLVMTGPAVPGRENRTTSVVVSDLFRQAQKTILVAGYAVYQGKKVFYALAERMVERPSLRARMFLDIQRKPGDSSSPAELVRRFAHRFQSDEWPTGIPTPEVFYDPRALSSDRVQRTALHAKCVVADGQEVFVSSANFTEAAQERNIEIGLRLHSTAIAERLTLFFDAHCDSGQFLRAL
jgi:phosphatidylserine/phosphatidylglycerophosphate/cardiolipin synthase-like enzyme